MKQELRLHKMFWPEVPVRFYSHQQYHDSIYKKLILHSLKTLLHNVAVQSVFSFAEGINITDAEALFSISTWKLKKQTNKQTKTTQTKKPLDLIDMSKQKPAAFPTSESKQLPLTQACQCESKSLLRADIKHWRLMI